MVALLPYIYRIPYDDDFENFRLRPYAMAYIVADKYQVQGLKLAVSEDMKRIIGIMSSMHPRQEDSRDTVRDFLDALRIVVKRTTTRDRLARKVIVEACTLNLQHLHRKLALLSLLRESANLGAEIIGHPDLKCGLPGDWECSGGCEGPIGAKCAKCDRVFGEEYARRNREDSSWTCESCGNDDDHPTCTTCENSVSWQRKGYE
jgi:hypothetical protein